jgi:hypothetical protein
MVRADDEAAITALVFMLDGMAVGHFLGQEYPRQDGRYRYMPYRGPGHYKLGVALREGRSIRCYFETDDGRVSFAVTSCPGYGFLELCDTA